MFKKFFEYLADTNGVTGIEYGFILGSISITLCTAGFMLGDDLSAIFETASAYINPSTIH